MTDDPSRPPPDPDLISLVVPAMNERESLPTLAGEIAEVIQGIGSRYELILVDDGSTDGTWDSIREVAANNPRVRGVRFRRNFGKAAALQAGFDRARGGVVLTLDADLQDDPAEIPNFLAALKSGRDLISGWKKLRRDPWHKVIPSRVFNGMVSALTGVKLHDHNCGYKAYRAEVLREIRLYGELHRFVPVLAAARGFTVGELAIRHRRRKFGRSKYGLRRFVKGFMDLLTVWFLTAFGDRPQHLLGSWGLAALVVFGLLIVIGPATPLVVGLGLFGGQLILTGLVAELVVNRGPADRVPYVIAEVTPDTTES